MKAAKATLQTVSELKLLFYPLFLPPHISNQIAFKLHSHSLLLPLNPDAVFSILCLVGYMVNAFFLLLLQVLLIVYELLNTKTSFF